MSELDQEMDADEERYLAWFRERLRSHRSFFFSEAARAQVAAETVPALPTRATWPSRIRSEVEPREPADDGRSVRCTMTIHEIHDFAPLRS